jgi:DNA-directed RNA polymerase subunit F
MSSDLAIPREMVDDMLAVAAVPGEQIDAIAAALEAQPGFLEKARLRELVEGIVTTKSLASSVVDALLNLRPQQLTQVLGALEKWRQASTKNAEKLSADALDRLKRVLPQFIKHYPALVRTRKAQRLQSILGNTVQGVELICDARPVDSIEGMIPVTTMRIEYEGQDEETHVAEFTLTTESVKEFADEIRKAQQKLKVLGQSIIQWIPDGLPTQNIPYTDTDDTFIQMQTFISSSRVQ